MRPQRIILTGFMGTGKSEVGRRVAAELGWSFQDTDALIEAETGRLIRDIFADDGEAAFRTMEQKALRQAIKAEPTVIATGGGAIVSEENRRRMKASGLLIALLAEPDEIYERLSEDQSRPLLQVDDPKAEILRLIRERQPFYEEADYVIDTTGRDCAGIAREVITRHETWSHSDSAAP